MNMFARCLLRKAGQFLSAAAVIGAAVGLIFHDRLHVSYAFGAMGGIYLAAGWFERIGKHFPWRFPSRKVPYFLRNRQTKRYRPSFRMDDRDFDDDLNSRTAVDEDLLTEKQQKRLRPCAFFAAAAICFMLSQFMPM